MTHVSILGTDCLKDIFGFHKGEPSYEIDAFVQNCNPLSLVMASPLLKEPDERFDEIFSAQSRFFCRCAKQDAEKTVFGYLAEHPSDWLLLDFAGLRWNLYATAKGGGTYRHPAEIQKLRDEGYLDVFSPLSSVSMGQDKVFSGLNLFLKRLLRYYKPEQIIIADLRQITREVNKKTGRSGYIGQDFSKNNALMESACQHALSRLPGSHFIPFPEHMPCDFNHKWGRNRIHYVQEYYDYAYEAVQLITRGGHSLQEEQKLVGQLRDNCDRAVKEAYEGYDRGKILFLNRELNTARRFKSYEQYFRKIILQDRRKALLDFFSEPGKTYALWGLNENSKLFLDLLGDKKDCISYIVYTSKEATYQGVPLIGEKAAPFPETDYLVVTDLEYEKIRPKVQAMPYWKKVTDYEELIRP